MKRYSISHGPTDVDEDPAGDWVLFSDVQGLAPSPVTLEGIRSLISMANSEYLAWLPDDDPLRAKLEAACDWLEKLQPTIQEGV